jgi:hypothetical protein
MNKLIEITIGLVMLIACSSNNMSTGLYLKDYYFPYNDFFVSKTYCYVNAIDTTDKSYWIMQTKIEGKDTLLITKIQDSNHKLTEELVEKIVKNGSLMLKYTLYKNDNNGQVSAPCDVIDSAIFNWNQNIDESFFWKVNFPEFSSKQTIEFTKKRTLASIDSINSLATFKDKNSMIMKGTFQKNEYEIENCYKKGIGLINYKIIGQGRILKDYKLFIK